MGGGVTNIRVKKLARQLGQPLPKLIDTLRRLGLERYAHPEAMLPGERLAQVREALTRPPAEPDFDTMMQSLGVRPLQEDHRTPSGRQKPPPPIPPKPEKPPRSQHRPVAPPSSGVATQPIVPPSGSPPDRSEDLAEALASVQASLQRVTRDLNREVKARRGAQAEATELRVALGRKAGEMAELQARISELEASLEAPAGGDAALLSLLAERGVQGPDEARRAVAALLRGRRFQAVVSELAVPRKDRFETLLRDHLLLHCGRDDCPPPAGEPVVQVAEERCEICGGDGLTGALQDFADALLLNGWTRVALQGGHPSLLRHLEAHLDRRIQLRFLGEGRLQDQAPPQVFIRWLPGDRAPTLVDGVLLSTRKTLGGMLRRVTRQLNRA